MAARTLPNLGLKAFYDLGEDGWKDDQDLNLLKLSVLTQATANALTVALPGSPVEGDVYILDETHATHPNEVAVFDDGDWVYVEPVEGWLIYDRSADVYQKFDGTEWVVLATGGGGGGGDVEEAPEDGQTYGRKDAAWVPVGGGAASISVVDVPITNPGAETGDLTGWTLSPAACFVASTNYGGGAPRTGANFFAAAAVTLATMTQDLDVTAYAAAIDDGRVQVQGAVFTQTTFTSSERSEFRVQCLDAANNVLGEQVEQIQGVGSMIRFNWNQLVALRWMPVGTRKIRLIAKADRLDGTNNDNSFDDFTCRLRIFGSPSIGNTECMIVAVSDEATPLPPAATNVITLRMPYAFRLQAVRASLTTASSSGLVTVDINEGGASILSTKLTVDATEKTSVTAATPAVISDPDLANDAEITIDIDGGGTGAAGLKVYLIGHRV